MNLLVNYASKPSKSASKGASNLPSAYHCIKAMQQTMITYKEVARFDSWANLVYWRGPRYLLNSLCKRYPPILAAQPADICNANSSSIRVFGNRNNCISQFHKNYQKMLTKLGVTVNRNLALGEQ